MKEIKKSKPTDKRMKKNVNPDSAHWIKSQAKLLKILEAAGMTPEKQKILITCKKDRQ